LKLKLFAFAVGTKSTVKSHQNVIIVIGEVVTIGATVIEIKIIFITQNQNTVMTSTRNILRLGMATGIDREDEINFISWKTDKFFFKFH
jgi:hypothetical protein